MTTERNDDRTTLARLQVLLDAYGGAPARWPDDERDAALALLERSAEARALRDEAARLDAVLDLLPAAEPSPELEERIVAAARRAGPPAAQPDRVASLDDARVRREGRTRRRSWMLAAVPLAAAAALALWLGAEQAGDPSAGTGEVVVATADDAPRADVEIDDADVVSGDDEEFAIALADLGSYSTPSDALLDVAAVDDLYADSGPWDGCSDGDLGCIEVDALMLEPVSRGGDASPAQEQEVRVLS